MVILVCDRHSQGAQQAIYFAPVTSNKSPARSGIEFRGEVAKPFGRVDGRIDADRYQVHIFPGAIQFPLHSAKRGRQWWADSCAGGENEINRYGLALN